jgi:hypothetical protein
MYVDNPDENKHTLKVKNFDQRTWSRPQDFAVFAFPRREHFLHERPGNLLAPCVIPG